MTLTTEDVLAVQQLAARYNHAVDAGDGAGFAATFTDDGVLVSGGEFRGRDALAQFGTSVPSLIPRPRHVVSNLLCEGDGDMATLKAYLHLYTSPGGGQPPVIAASGTYNDVLRRESGEWLFVSRTFTPD